MRTIIRILSREAGKVADTAAREGSFKDYDSYRLGQKLKRHEISPTLAKFDGFKEAHTAPGSPCPQ